MQFASIPYAFAPYPPSLLLPHREQECGGRPDARNERWNAATRQTAHPCVHRPRRCHRSIRHSPHLKRAKFQQKRYGTVGTGTAIRPRRVPTQAALPVALTPGASSADTATVGAPPDGDDTGAAIPRAVERRRPPPPGWGRRAEHTAGGYDRRSGASVTARVRPGKNGMRICTSSRITCGRFGRACARRCAAVESSADHGRRVCQLRLPGDCAHQGVRSPSTSRC
jgi:hypothetical protein